MAEVQWHSIEPAPVVLIAGKEALLAQRALERIVRLSRERHADLEIHRFTSTEITKSDVLQYTAPSLFGEPRLVIIDEVTRGAEPLINALMEYVQSPEQDVTLVLINRGDQRAKKLLDAVKKSGAPWVNAAEIKTAKAKMTFAMSEFSRARRRVNSDAVKALVDAFGADLMELAAVSTQLMRDTEPEPGQQAGPITLRHVEALTAGRAETTRSARAASPSRTLGAVSRCYRRDDCAQGQTGGAGSDSRCDGKEHRHAGLDVPQQRSARPPLLGASARLGVRIPRCRGCRG